MDLSQQPVASALCELQPLFDGSASRYGEHRIPPRGRDSQGVAPRTCGTAQLESDRWIAGQKNVCHAGLSTVGAQFGALLV